MTNLEATDYDRIIYFQAENKKVYIVTEDGYKVTDCPLSKIEEELPEGDFFRIHRTCIVNLNYIKSYKNDSVTLENNVTLPVSRYRLKDFQKTFYRKLNQKCK